MHYCLKMKEKLNMFSFLSGWSIINTLQKELLMTYQSHTSTKKDIILIPIINMISYKAQNPYYKQLFKNILKYKKVKL